MTATTLRVCSRLLHIALLILALALAPGAEAGAGEAIKKPAAPLASFKPGQLWPDTGGVHINAHGGGILLDGDTYYWFGEHKVAGERGNYAWVGISCYSSKDLYNWKSEGIVLPVVQNAPGHDLTPGCIMERPKVIYNDQTKKYVMWFHLELSGQGYKAARVGVAVADKATGPYAYRGSFRPDGAMSRDMTLFVDDDRKAYLICASEDNHTMHVSLLSDDYLKPAGKFQRIFEGRFMEAPAIFKYQGRYYFTGSGCTGWKPNTARSAVAPSIWGPWKELGNPCRGPKAELTFMGQSTYVLPVAGRPGCFIWMGDQWRPRNQIDSRYLWLPVRFEGEGFTVEWKDEWKLEEQK